ncbi:2OG-Fe(II) oxygenase superfamily protein [Apodospora peruviana]|uniref:2OG-Fe(II) oxygenase superfamily protein n=1 Tax=Apodospora peruviana TaxID=516989 RepID=A0AAE0HX32_9PEZI|nr:2OG-Fe(II) oxygenase superfamily protein [Apodospora peruviana]
MRPVLPFLALTLPSLASTSDSSAQAPIVNSEEYVCKHPPYQVQIVSSSPLVIYIRDFLTERERAHLKSISKNTFRTSAVGSGSKAARRTSQSTYLPSTDPIVSCIEQRATLFQGYDVHPSQLEPLQLVHYSPGEHYHLHTDWFSDEAYKMAVNGGNRLSSFFAYVSLSNDTTGGGTNFPLVNAPRDPRWCDVIDCDEQWERGVTFRPMEGNAVYWENLEGDGTGNHRTVHAGLPVTTGDKIGMNIWTRQLPLSDEVRGRFEYPDL